MGPNQYLITKGGMIHDALRHFARVSDENWILLNLQGGCAVASYFLLKEAQHVGIEATFQVGCGHCWVESAGYIYDVTASQFICDDNDTAMDQSDKVRVMGLSEIPMVTGIFNLPRSQWGSDRYSMREHDSPTSENNVSMVRTMWPLGQSMRGYHIRWTSDKGKAHITWKGKNKIIG